MSRGEARVVEVLIYFLLDEQSKVCWAGSYTSEGCLSNNHCVFSANALCSITPVVLERNGQSFDSLKS